MHTLWDMYAPDTTIGEKAAHMSSYTCGIWSGALNETYAVPAMASSHYRVAGIDGSQIYPDKHVGIPAYLIHIACVEMEFGDNAYANITSHPYVTMSQEYVSSTYVDMVRLYYEIGQMHTVSSHAYVLTDGPLMWRSLADYGYLSQAIAWCDHACQRSCWPIGYMSSPTFHHITNALRAVAHTSLSEHAYHVTDVQLMRDVIPLWHRTRMSRISDSIITQYPQHLQPYFCYLHTEHEVARIEMPAYIAQSHNAVDHVMVMIRNQIEKGHGYPVALSESHEAAVIRESDRQFFRETLARYTEHDSISSKQRLKHRPVI